MIGTDFSPPPPTGNPPETPPKQLGTDTTLRIRTSQLLKNIKKRTTGEAHFRNTRIRQRMHIQHELETSAAISIQRVWRGFYARLQIFIKGLGDHLQQLNYDRHNLNRFIMQTESHLRMQFERGAIALGQFNNGMVSLRSLSTAFNEIELKFQEHIAKASSIDRDQARAFYDTMCARIQFLTRRLREGFGYPDMMEMLQDVLDSGFSELSGVDYLLGINELFVPTGYRWVDIEFNAAGAALTHSTFGTRQVDNNSLASGHNALIKPTLFGTETFYGNLCGAELIIPIAKEGAVATQALVVRGNFPPKSRDLRYTNLELLRKKQKFASVTTSVETPKGFKADHLEQFSTRDFYFTTPQQYRSILVADYAEYVRLQGMTNATIFDEFKALSHDLQVKMMALLIMGGDLATVANLLIAIESESYAYGFALRHSLCESLQKKVMDYMFDLETCRKNIAKMDLSSIPYDKRILASNMPPKAKAIALDFAKKAKGGGGLFGGGHDASKVQSWLDRILSIPFGKEVPMPVGPADSDAAKLGFIQRVRDVLNQKVRGQEKAKEAVSELLAEWISNGSTTGEVIAIQGPPGNGKTTFGHAIAEALGRPLEAIALGGDQDSATLLGHDFTYVGSKCGRVVECLVNAGCSNPVIFFDELDKVSQTPRGEEIIGVLTHLTDPSQNAHFEDHYFSGVPIDLSKALIIFSFNDESKVDHVLKNRMKVIRTKALSTQEKIDVMRRPVMPEIYQKLSFQETDVVFSDDILRYIIERYTRDSGARKIKDHVKTIMRQIRLRALEQKLTLPVTVTEALVEDILGQPKVLFERVGEHNRVGVAHGMWANELGEGGILPIQVFRDYAADRRYKLTLTGSQGDVMKESMNCALNVALRKLPPTIRQELASGEQFGVHIHCPDTSMPKDGPSAGGVITSTIISQLTGVPIRRDVVMTGEIDLDGNITAIGGLDRKLNGAKRAGAVRALVPEQNRRDVEEVMKDYPDLCDDHFEVVFVSHIDQALPYLLEENELEFPNIGPGASNRRR